MRYVREAVTLLGSGVGRRYRLAGKLEAGHSVAHEVAGSALRKFICRGTRCRVGELLATDM